MTRAKAVAPQDSDDIDEWNREDAAELQRPARPSAYEVAISARDWTVGTIVQQVSQENIDLDPAFQRRNAWRDARRSRLVESFILSFPVPQIVLAENPRKRKSYIVIDGKQRLMSIAGFFLPEFRAYWKAPVLSGLEILKDLNGVSIDDFLSKPQFAQYRRQLDNADIRATVLSGFRDEGVLYDIFYRINTGSVPLSSQELRQVLNRGAFARFLLDVTSQENAIWRLLGIAEPDARLRDVELLLRLIAWTEFSGTYAGNMKKFLDDTMTSLNASWSTNQKRIREVVEQILLAVDTAQDVFGDTVGRKYKDGKYEGTLNRAVLEVQAVFLVDKAIRASAIKRKAAVKKAFVGLSADASFLAAVESTTKSLENTRARFSLYRKVFGHALGKTVKALPIGKSE
ncbi:MAG TPA: DUF262 domain-containing protein [Bryobacteraceae bacterium]|nr:DUF262 domain-containing protein [Bryobacteraceae bacterium]